MDKANIYSNEKKQPILFLEMTLNIVGIGCWTKDFYYFWVYIPINDL